MTNLKSWIPIGWVIFLVVASLQPLRPGVDRPGSLTHLLLHVLVFGFTAFLWQKRPALPWVAFLGTLCLAAAIELSQHWIYGKPYEWQDLCADALGIALAILPWVLPRNGGLRDSA